jgi:hypothetical protein
MRATRLSVANYNTTPSSDSLETGTGSSNSLRSTPQSRGFATYRRMAGKARVFGPSARARGAREHGEFAFPPRIRQSYPATISVVPIRGSPADLRYKASSVSRRRSYVQNSGAIGPEWRSLCHEMAARSSLGSIYGAEGSALRSFGDHGQFVGKIA